ncbi:MAG: hypothetical protein ABF289_06540 [Clostridiales bacterium]
MDRSKIIADFIESILVKILKLRISGKTYKKYNVSENIYYNYTLLNRKHKYIGYAAAKTLTKIIVEETKLDSIKKNILLDYFQQFLSDEEKIYVKKHFDDIENISWIVISKFVKSKISNQVYLYQIRSLDSNIKEDYAKKIKSLYTSAISIMKTEPDIMCIVTNEINNRICRILAKLENIKNHVNNTICIDKLFAKGILPQNVSVSMKAISNMSYNENTNILQIKEVSDLCYSNLKIFSRWFNNQYLNSDLNRIESNIKIPNDGLKVLSIFDLMEIGWTIKDYVIEATKLNYEVIDDLTPEHNGEIEQLTLMISKHPENRRILLDENNNMIGYWSLEPLFDDIFEKAKNGELFDNELTADKIAVLVPGVYNVYFSSICLKEDHRKKYAFKKLLFSLIDYLEELALDGVFFNEICTLAYSDDGKSLSKTIGLRLHKNHIDHGEIYCGNIYDILSQPICKNYDSLRTLYNQI